MRFSAERHPSGSLVHTRRDTPFLVLARAPLTSAKHTCGTVGFLKLLTRPDHGAWFKRSARRPARHCGSLVCRAIIVSARPRDPRRSTVTVNVPVNRKTIFLARHHCYSARDVRNASAGGRRSCAAAAGEGAVTHGGSRTDTRGKRGFHPPFVFSPRSR